jgi:threonine/homoserine/homoserine lactone efflux protein
MDGLLPTTTLPVFITTSLVLLLTPGPAVLYIITRSIDQGRKAGLVSVLGVEIGNTFHVVAAALGVSVILASSALAFSIVKYLGAAYLIYLGIRKLLAHGTVEAAQPTERKSLRSIFSQGVFVAALNPKTALFFLAFLTQFVDHTRGSAPFQTLLLGLMFVSMATLTDSLYALLSGSLGRWLKGNLRFLRFERYFAGIVYFGLGAAALSGNNAEG